MLALILILNFMLEIWLPWAMAIGEQKPEWGAFK
jgi:hypothetical protein